MSPRFMPVLPLLGPATVTFGGMMCGALSATSFPAWSYLQCPVQRGAQRDAKMHAANLDESVGHAQQCTLQTKL